MSLKVILIVILLALKAAKGTEGTEAHTSSPIKVGELGSIPTVSQNRVPMLPGPSSSPIK
jgi:hypothetical protein